MRHYFNLNADGEVIGRSVHPGGFTDDHDLTDPGCMHPLVKGIRRLQEGMEDFDRCIEFECPCPSSVGECDCPQNKSIEVYADGQVLRDKPALSVIVNGAPLTHLVDATPLTAVVGTELDVRLEADCPDGHEVTLRAPSRVSLISSDETLTFSGGVTNTVKVTAPAVGVTGVTFGVSKYVRQFRIRVRGATA